MPFPNPRELSFDRWASDVVDLSGAAGFAVPRHPDEDGWRAWSDRLLETDLDVPRHDLFDSWQDWGERFLELNDGVIDG